jgi:hypothetical protein
MKSFSAKILIIGINPYVLLPANILKYLFEKAGKEKGAIPVYIILNDKKFIQNVVKYSGKWRLYLNTPMRMAVDKQVGNIIDINIDYDGEKRVTSMIQKFELALSKNKSAKDCFYDLPSSRQKEILRYLNHLKTDESIERNIKRAINFLNGKENFVGRSRPR